MKKIVLSLAVLATVALVSCGKGNANADSESAAVDTNATEAPAETGVTETNATVAPETAAVPVETAAAAPAEAPAEPAK